MDAHTQALIEESERLLRGEFPLEETKARHTKSADGSSVGSGKISHQQGGNEGQLRNSRSAGKISTRRKLRRKRPKESALVSKKSDVLSHNVSKSNAIELETEHQPGYSEIQNSELHHDGERIDADSDSDSDDSLMYSEDEDGDFYVLADDQTIAEDRARDEELKQVQATLDIRQDEREAAMATREQLQNDQKKKAVEKRICKRTKRQKDKKPASLSTSIDSDKVSARVKRNSIAEINSDKNQLAAEALKQGSNNNKSLNKASVSHLRPSVQGPAPPTNHGGEVSALGDREWENELARSILVLYNANSINETEQRTARTGTPSSKKTRGGNRQFFASNLSTPKNNHLSSNVSLPSLSSAPRQRSSPSRATSSVAAKELKQPKPIWFYGSGRLRAVWCAISNRSLRMDVHRLSNIDPSRCTHRLCRELRELEKKAKYEDYIDRALDALREFTREAVHERAQRRREATQQLALSDTSQKEKEPADLHTCDLKPSINQPSEFSEMQGTQDAYMIDYATLDPSLLQDDDEHGGGLVERMMWRQLVACCNIFGSKLSDLGRFGGALQVFKQAEELLDSTSALDGGTAFVGAIRIQLRAFTMDGLGYYYYKRKKTNAASLYVQKAMRAHHRLQQWEHVAKCHLHCGAILSLMSKHEESIKCLAQILDMVDDERLQVGGTSAQKICMVAVCYHNIAVEQLLLRRPAEACVSSQNARRLARLSLSYANRWINYFERTHQYTLQRLTSQHSYVSGGKPGNKSSVPRQRTGKNNIDGDDEKMRTSLKNPSLQKFYGNIASALE